MDITGILLAVAAVGGVGLFVGVFLGIAAIKFKLEVDEREAAVLEALPGNNCGGCGFPGCSGLAAAIAKGEAPVNACPVGGEPVGRVIAGIMGVTAEEKKRMVAFVQCQGDCDKTSSDYEYTGIHDCRMLSFVPNGGAKSCNYGCLGYGSCVSVCPFDAIHVVNGVAKVDKLSLIHIFNEADKKISLSVKALLAPEPAKEAEKEDEDVVSVDIDAVIANEEN